MVKTKQKKLLKDNIATKILKSDECKEYVASIIASTIGIDRDYVIKNLKMIDPYISANEKVKNQEVDALFKTDIHYINIEINYTNNKKTKIKNDTYVAELLVRQTVDNKEYLNLKPIIQINLNNYDYYKKNEFIYHTVMMEEKYKIKRGGVNSEIYDIDLDFLSNIDYTEIMKLTKTDLKRLLYIFVCEDKLEREKICEGNEMMETVDKKMESFLQDLDSLLYYDYDEFIKQNANDHVYSLGARDKAIETAKKLLKLNVNTIEQIAECTGLSIEDVEEIKSELEEQ